MHTKKWATFLRLLALLAAGLLFLPAPLVQAQTVTPPSPYDLIAAVNNLRASNGAVTLQPNNALMASAQAHSQYQASIGTYTHTGPGGSDETMRARAAGYGGGSNIACDEAVAVARVSSDVDYVVNNLWADYTHRNLVLLNPRYTDIGAGVAVSGGLAYITVDNCTTEGGSSSSAPLPTSGPGTLQPPTRTAEIIKAVLTATPKDNGAIIHRVEPGQTLWSIATAYGTTVDQLVGLNNLSAKNPMIYAGQTLLVRAAFTPTLSPTITETSRPPTRTPRPTFTTRPTEPTFTPTVTFTPTPQPIITLPDLNNQKRWLGISLVAACGLGLLAVLAGSLRAHK